MNHLIREVATELEVDAARAIQGLKQDKDLWNRLAKLREKKETKIENLGESSKQSFSVILCFGMV